MERSHTVKYESPIAFKLDPSGKWLIASIRVFNGPSDRDRISFGFCERLDRAEDRGAVEAVLRARMAAHFHRAIVDDLWGSMDGTPDPLTPC